MGNNPSVTKGAKLPVTNVSWNDCQDYIKRLNAKTNGGYRLPTDAEWEYACRAGKTTVYSFGNNITKKDANFDGSGRPVLVGNYFANSFVLYDMHGNVWELCEDWVGDYLNGAALDPKGPEKGKIRVGHGGSFDHSASSARSSNRGGLTPSEMGSSVGLRLARTP